jgi:ATP/maltotriose-dependent transcriptional regulator MalT
LAECLREGEEAVEIAHQIGWRSGEANALIYLGFALGPRGEYTHALECAQAALDISQEIEHPVMAATAHFSLGVVYLDLFALSAAQQHFEQSLKLSQATRWMFMYSGVSGCLASTHAAQHQLDKAGSILNAAFPPETLPQTQWQRLAVFAHAELELARGDPDVALRFIERLVATAPHADNESGVIPRLWHLRGQALAALGRMKEAQDVLEAGREAAHAQEKRPILWRIQLSLGKVYQAQGRRKEAEAAFVAARALVEELAAHLADTTLRDIFLKGANALLPSPPTVTPRRAARREFGGLTERERQVAALIAEGKSNREIAEVLVVSPRTVEVHIANIMSKRGYTSRAQIAAWAVEKGLTKI